MSVYVLICLISSDYWDLHESFRIILRSGRSICAGNSTSESWQELDIAAWTWPPPSIVVILGRKTTNQVANQAGFPRSPNLVSIWLGIFAPNDFGSAAQQKPQPSASFWRLALGLTFHLTSSERKGEELSHCEETNVCRMKSLLNCWRQWETCPYGSNTLADKYPSSDCNQKVSQTHWRLSILIPNYVELTLPCLWKDCHRSGTGSDMGLVMSFETPMAQKFDLSVFSCSSCPGVANMFSSSDSLKVSNMSNSMWIWLKVTVIWHCYHLPSEVYTMCPVSVRWHQGRSSCVAHCYSWQLDRLQVFYLGCLYLYYIFLPLQNSSNMRWYFSNLLLWPQAYGYILHIW